MWTLDARVDVTPAGLAAATRRRNPRAALILPTEEGRAAVAPLLQARDAIVIGLQPRRLTDAQKAEILREEAEAARCQTCAGREELETNGGWPCPDCTPEMDERP